MGEAVKSRLLFTVEDVFLIRDRGLILVPGLERDERIGVGDPLLLKMPDGSSATASVAGIEFSTPNPRHMFPILLNGLTKDDVPIGTEVWSVDPVKTPPAAPSAPAG
jgi:hypothetical protein